MEMRAAGPSRTADTSKLVAARDRLPTLKRRARLHVKILALRTIGVIENDVIARTVALKIHSCDRAICRSDDGGSSWCWNIDASVFPTNSRHGIASHSGPGPYRTRDRIIRGCSFWKFDELGCSTAWHPSNFSDEISYTIKQIAPFLN